MGGDGGGTPAGIGGGGVPLGRLLLRGSMDDTARPCADWVYSTCRGSAGPASASPGLSKCLAASSIASIFAKAQRKCKAR